MGNYLITGAMGCIGAWTLYHLQQRGDNVISFDISEKRHRLDLLMSKDEQNAITFIKGDLTDFEQVKTAIAQHEITHIIHLAALQVPFVKADPVMGARVNVTGTTIIFEAARQAGITHVTYASSIAAYGAREDYPAGLVAHDAPKLPRTLYGVFKATNEETARIFHQDHGMTSTALRPYTVYGLGRDQGLTSEPTKAMVAAAKGESYDISFGGKMQFHYASDVAKQFIGAADKPLDGAYGFTLGGAVTAVNEVAKIITDVKPDVTITVGDKELPFPEGFDDAELRKHFTIYETPLAEGIRATMAAVERMGNT